MKLSELICDLPVLKVVGNDEDIDINYLSCRTDRIKTNTMYFCLKGSNIDGHFFASKVVEDGAVALVVERILDLDKNVVQLLVEDSRAFMALAAKNYYRSACDNLKIIGVTGTNGKTSTTHILKSIFNVAGYKTGVIGTNGVWIGEARYPAQLTTPDPIELHEWFYKMFVNGVEYVVMEASAHAIVLNKLDGVNFEVSVLTNFGQDHLDYFLDMQSYAAAKKKLFTKKYTKIAIVNGDDDLGIEISRENKVPVLTFGLNNPCDIFAIDVAEHKDGVTYTLNLCDEVQTVSYRLQGKFNVYNTLCASAVARVLGIKIAQITQGINAVKCIEGRNEVYLLKNGCKAVVDFAHTPEGFDNILSYLRSVTEGKLICVFGCGGDRDKLKRPLIASKVSRWCDYAIITNDNPRYENPQNIFKDIIVGIKIKYDIVEDRKTAILQAINTAQSFDTVAILGKGAEQFQEYKGRRYAFCDAEIVKRFTE